MTTQNCVWGHICPLSMRLADVSKPTGGLLAAGTLVSLSFHHKQGLNPRQTPSRGTTMIGHNQSSPWGSGQWLWGWLAERAQLCSQLDNLLHTATTHGKTHCPPTPPISLVLLSHLTKLVRSLPTHLLAGHPLSGSLKHSLPDQYCVLRTTEEFGQLCARRVLAACGRGPVLVLPANNQTCSPLLPCPCCDRHHHRGH